MANWRCMARCGSWTRTFPPSRATMRGCLATVCAFAEQVMEKVALRAQNAARLEPFTGAAWKVEADDFQIRGFTPARAAKGSVLTMTFKKPHEVVGNHIAKYQALRLSKMLMMAYDFERHLNPFAELGGFIFTFMGDGAPGTGKTTLHPDDGGTAQGVLRQRGIPVPLSEFRHRQYRQLPGQVGGRMPRPLSITCLTRT